MGRKAKPTKVQIAEGDPAKRGKGKLRQQLADEPNAARGLPDCPQHVVGMARDAWEFWKYELEAMQLDCRPDAMMLEGACVHYARAVDADLRIAKEGSVVNDAVLYKGEILEGVVRIKKHPSVSVSNASWAHVKAFCSEFGLSPVARTRLTIEKRDTSEAEMQAALSKPRVQRDAIQ